MRNAISALTRAGLLVVPVLALVACGGGQKKPADTGGDSKSESGSDDTKWEGATAEDTRPRNKPTSTAGASSAGSSGDSSPSHVPVAEAPKQRSDQYDKEHTDIVLNRSARQVKANCGQATDDNGKAAGPFGKVTINVMLGHNGRSKGVTVPAPFDGTPPGRCITQAFSNLTFPPWGGADTPVDIEVEVVKPK
jgi:hypothetical protein